MVARNILAKSRASCGGIRKIRQASVNVVSLSPKNLAQATRVRRSFGDSVPAMIQRAQRSAVEAGRSGAAAPGNRSGRMRRAKARSKTRAGASLRFYALDHVPSRALHSRNSTGSHESEIGFITLSTNGAIGVLPVGSCATAKFTVCQSPVPPAPGRPRPTPRFPSRGCRDSARS